MVTESRNFILVEVAPSSLDVLGLPGEKRVAAIRRVAEALFALRGSADFAILAGSGEVCAPADIDEGAMLCSDPSVDPALLSCWNERAECGIRHGGLYFLCYKKSGQRAGYENAQQWFDDDWMASDR